MSRAIASPDRREQLLDAALTAFAEHGYNGAKVSDVVSAAGVAQGTFYLYFKSKREVLLALVDRFLGLVVREVRTTRGARPSTFDEFRQAMVDRTTEILRIVADNRPLAALFFRESVGADVELEERLRAFHETLADDTGQNLREAIALGFLRPVDTRLVAYAINGMWERVCLHAVIRASEPPDLGRLADELISLQLDGLRARQS